MRILFIYESLAPPYDEGLKKLSHEIYLRLKVKYRVRIIKDIDSLPSKINSLLIIPRIFILAILYKRSKIVYIPKQSLTFSSLIKVLALSLFFKKRMVVVGLQRKKISKMQRWIINRLNNFPLLFVLSSAMAKDLENIGVVSKILPLGIDVSRFRPNDDRPRLRDKYDIPIDKFVLLHVGHIKISRNIRWLEKVQKAYPNIQVLIIGSTSTEQDELLLQELTNSGVIILRKVLNEIEEVYQLSDCYCFPVLENEGAMEVPLSVIESMATNLPVVTTPFGRLPELFQADKYFAYIDSSNSLMDVMGNISNTNCNNRSKIISFSWEKVTDSLLS